MNKLHHPLPLRPLAACLAIVVGASAAQAAPLAAPAVQNCLDHGAGSLRQAIIDNTSGAPIDLTQLNCSSITLTSGAIYVTRNQLIKGPGAALLTIDGAHSDRVFSSTTANTTLALYGMTIQNGYASALGAGCVYAAGTLQLKDTVIRSCRVSDVASSGTVGGGGVRVHGDFLATDSSIVDNEIYSALGSAIGGGAFVDGNAALLHSSLSGNEASAFGNVKATGGLDVGGQLTLSYATIENNHVTGSPSTAGTTGGVRGFKGASITQSTISGNSTDGGDGIGGIIVYGMNTTNTTNTIVNSTISGNSAARVSGLSISGKTNIQNSTIAFNVQIGSNNFGAVHVYSSVRNTALDIQSTIIAANMSTSGQAQNLGFSGSVPLSGANNLIGPSPSVTLPPDTIGGDPMLFPLHANGGETKTHALKPGSPAVGAGNNASSLPSDQRGPGYPRIVGTSADIGAYEGVDAQTVFFSSFD